MSTSINTVFICGNVTKDADVSTLKDGQTKVAIFNVATSEGGYKLADGTEVPERTQFHRVVAWRGLASLAEKAIKTGVMVAVEGKLTYRHWYDDEESKTGRHDIAEIVAVNVKVAGKSERTGGFLSSIPDPDPELAPVSKEENLPF